MVYGRKVGKTVRMNLAGMNSITRIEVPNITREAQNLEILIGHLDGWMNGTPAHMPRYAQVNHLLDRVEVRVVEIPQEPKNPRSENLSQEDDEGGEVEDVHHPDQPVDEDRCPRRGCEGLESKHKSLGIETFVFVSLEKQ